MRHILTILLLITISISNVVAQNERTEIDSLFLLFEKSDDNKRIEVLNEISRQYWNISLDSSFYYANEALNLAHIIGNKKGISDSYNRIGNVYYYQNDLKKALEFYEKCLDIRLELEDSKAISNIYNNIALIYSFEERYGLSLEHFNAALEESIKRNDTEDIYNYYYLIGETYFFLGDYANALTNYNSSLDKALEINNKEDLGTIYNSLGNIYSEISSFDDALENFFKALELFQELEIQDGISMMYNNIGIVYQQQKNTEEALSYYQRSLSMGEKLGDKYGIATALNNLGTAYDENGEQDLALDYYNRALELNKELELKDGVATAQNNIGLIYLNKKDFNKAYVNLMESTQLFEELNDKYGTSNAYNNLANLFLQQNNLSQAKQYLDKASEIAKKVNAKEYLIESYELYSKYYSEQKDHKKSLEYYKLYSELSDSVYKATSSNKMNELKAKFDADFFKAENEILKKDNEIQQLQLNRQKNIQKYWIGFTVLIILLFVLVFQRFNLKRKTNNLLKLKNNELRYTNTKLIESEHNLKDLNATKDKFFSIIAHDLKNPFQSLLGFSESLHVNLDNLKDEDIKEYSSLIYNSAQNLYNLLGNLLQWAKTQLGSTNLIPKSINIYEALLDILEILNLTAKTKNISINYSIDEETYAYADKHVVKVLFSNLINNAIKFTDNGGEINISAIYDEKFIIVSVKDNGCGMSVEEVDKLFRIDESFSKKGTNNESGTGLGLILCKELIKESNGEILVESEPNIGSTFKFKLPLPQE